METKWWAYVLVFASTLVNVAAQTAYKYASSTFGWSLSGTVLNVPLLIGLCCYAVSAALLILGFRGGQLSTLFPILALSFVWVVIVAALVLQEHVSIANIIGMAVIIVGVLLITTGEKT